MKITLGPAKTAKTTTRVAAKRPAANARAQDRADILAAKRQAAARRAKTGGSRAQVAARTTKAKTTAHRPTPGHTIVVGAKKAAAGRGATMATIPKSVAKPEDRAGKTIAVTAGGTKFQLGGVSKPGKTVAGSGTKAHTAKAANRSTTKHKSRNTARKPAPVSKAPTTKTPHSTDTAGNSGTSGGPTPTSSPANLDGGGGGLGIDFGSLLPILLIAGAGIAILYLYTHQSKRRR